MNIDDYSIIDSNDVDQRRKRSSLNVDNLCDCSSSTVNELDLIQLLEIPNTVNESFIDAENITESELEIILKRLVFLCLHIMQFIELNRAGKNYNLPTD